MQQRGKVFFFFLQSDERARKTVFFCFVEVMMDRKVACASLIQVVTGDARAQSLPSRSGSSQRLFSVLAV